MRCFDSDLLRSITDPEHPLTLEQLAVVSPSQIKISNRPGSERVLVEFTPTSVRLRSSYKILCLTPLARK